MADLKAKLMSKVVDIPSYECWEYVGYRDPYGYGQFQHNLQKYQAHRASYEVFVGPIPEGVLVCHECDNPCCVNPLHLWLGSDHDNAVDRNTKGRNARTDGEYGGNTKLSALQVLELKNMALSGLHTHQEIANHFGVSRTTVAYIKHGISWRCLENTNG